MQRQEANRRLDILARLGGEADNLQAGTVDALAKLVNSNVRGRTDKNLATIDFGKM